jgi:outer membrane protein
VGVARADLLPKVDLSLSYFRVDNNLSQASSGLIPEFVYSGTALIRQNLFSEPIWASLSTKTHQADASRESTRQTELDIVQAALNAYAQVLLARQQVRQQQDNIARTRANLAIARSKLAAGASSRSDVYRWESQLARAESSLQSAEASAKIAEISINRILHRPLDQPVSLQEIGFDHPEFWVSDARLRNRFNTAEGFRALEAFLVSESLRNSPEVKNLDQQLAAAARSVGSDKAKFVLPSLTADALVTHTFNANMPGALGPSVSPVPLAFSALDSTQWALSLNLAYNLFNGLGDLAKLREDAEKLHQLEVTRASAREGIEQALRQAMQRVRAAYVSIALEQTSAKSAGQNYELVRRAYVRGAQSITDLTDAQNNAFNADVGASTSVYSFFQAYFNMERALGTFDVMQTEQERADFTSRLALLEKK